MNEAAMLASSSRVKLYIQAILALCLLAVVFVLGIVALRPENDSTTSNLSIIATVLGVFTPIVAALMAQALKENHDAMNSRLTQLLELTDKASRAEGKLAGKIEGKIEGGAIAATVEGIVQ